jgi:hypothetical protein
MIAYTIMTDISDTDGLDYAQTIDVFFGDVSPWHDAKESAEAALTELETTGAWPDGRPKYWIEEGHNEYPWERLREPGGYWRP